MPELKGWLGKYVISDFIGDINRAFEMLNSTPPIDVASHKQLVAVAIATAQEVKKLTQAGSSFYLTDSEERLILRAFTLSL